ncbi:MAG TPA: hypothetical protein VF131_12240 [Blastocatellia bacterium]|nr:hypothetical protein [Blastocatellia bacterium]
MKKRSWMLAIFLFNPGLLVFAIADGGVVAEGGAEPAEAEAVTRTARVDGQVIKEFEKAWAVSSAGTSNQEGVVLIFRMFDGSYRAQSQGNTNQHKKFTFKFTPNAVAIVHTHPNGIDPRPSSEDAELSDKLGVPVFTITTRGMFMYNPKTKQTTKVMEGMDWLDRAKWRYKEFLPATARRRNALDLALESNQPR